MPRGVFERTIAIRNKISKSMKAYERTEEHIDNLLKAHLGNKHSLGLVRTPESIQKQLATKRKKKTLTYKLINKLRGLFI